MSWKATAWAKDTRHRNAGQKFVLMILADYHDAERGVAWPSQARLASDCQMDERTIRRHLRNLVVDGFVVVEQKGNQFQPSKYRLTFVSGARSCEPDISAADKSPGTKVNRTNHAGEPDTGRWSSHQEPPVDNERKTTSKESKHPWLEVLRRDPRWSDPSRQWVQNFEKRFTGMDLVLEAGAAIDWLKTPAGVKKKRLVSFWLNWCKNSANKGPAGESNGRTARNDPERYLEAAEREAAARRRPVS